MLAPPKARCVRAAPHDVVLTATLVMQAAACDVPTSDGARSTMGGRRDRNLGESVRVDRPGDASLPDDKFAVFIGINEYPNLKLERQLHGCVNDACAMEHFFADGGGFR